MGLLTLLVWGISRSVREEQARSLTTQDYNQPQVAQEASVYVTTPNGQTPVEPCRPVYVHRTRVIAQTLAIRPYVPDYAGWSVINFFLCCPILAIVALIFSCVTQDYRRQGEHEKAKSNSRVAFWLNLATTITGIVMYIALIIWVTTTNSTSSYHSDYESSHNYDSNYYDGLNTYTVATPKDVWAGWNDEFDRDTTTVVDTTKNVWGGWNDVFDRETTTATTINWLDLYNKLSSTEKPWEY